MVSTTFHFPSTPFAPPPAAPAAGDEDDERPRRAPGQRELADRRTSPCSNSPCFWPRRHLHNSCSWRTNLVAMFCLRSASARATSKVRVRRALKCGHGGGCGPFGGRRQRPRGKRPGGSGWPNGLCQPLAARRPAGVQPRPCIPPPRFPLKTGAERADVAACCPAIRQADRDPCHATRRRPGRALVVVQEEATCPSATLPAASSARYRCTEAGARRAHGGAGSRRCLPHAGPPPARHPGRRRHRPGGARPGVRGQASLAHTILQLQRQHGNRHVGQLLRQTGAPETTTGSTIEPDGGGMASIERALDQTRGSGQGMDHGTRSRMEAHLGRLTPACGSIPMPAPMR